MPIKKSQIYQQGKIGERLSPQLGKEDVEEIKKIRTKRYRQELIGQKKREAEPIKKQNISKIQNQINNYQAEIKREKQRIQDLKKEEREVESEEKADEIEWEIDEKEAEIRGAEKALKELKKREEQYKKFEWNKVLANKDYANKVRDYADDIQDAEVREEQNEIKREKREKELKKKGYTEIPGAGWVKPEDIGLKKDLWSGKELSKKEMDAFGISVEDGKISREQPLSYQDKEKIAAWMEKNKMSPTPETIKEILKKPKVKLEKTQRAKDYTVSYENILTGQKVSIDPKIAKKDALLRPVAVDPKTGEKLSEYKQFQLKLDKPKLFETEPKTTKEKFTAELAKETAESPGLPGITDVLEASLASGALTKGLQKVRKEKNEMFQWFGEKLDQYKLGVYKKELEQARKNIDKKNISSEQKQLEKKRIERAERVIKDIEKEGTSVASSLTISGIRMASNLLPPIAIVDLGTMIAPETAKFAAETHKKWDKWTNTGNMSIEDWKDIAKSNPVTNMPYEAVEQTFKNIKKEGFFEGLADTSVDAYNNVVNFYTLADVTDRIKEQEKEINKELSELKKDKEKYTTESYNKAVTEYKNAQKEIEKALENVKKQRELRIGNTALAVATVGIGGARYFGRKMILKASISRYDDAVRQYNKLKSIVKQDGRIKVGKGYSQTNSYLVKDFSKLDDIQGIKNQIPNLKNVKKIDIVKDSQAYLSRSPVFKKVEVPKSIRNIAKGGKKDYYITYLPELQNIDNLAPSQLMKVPGYNINYKNAITFAVQYKDGSQKLLSFVARNNKPLPNFRKPLNAIKYGAGKKLVASSKVGDDIVLSQVRKIRGGRTIPQENLFSRAAGTAGGVRRVDVRKATKARKPGMSAEDYWNISPKKGISFVQKAGKKKTKARYSPESFFLGRKAAQTGKTISKTKSYSSPVTIDTGYLSIFFRNRLNQLKQIKKPGKKAKIKPSQKALKTVSNKIDEAAKKGKNRVTLKAETMNKLSKSDLEAVRGAVLQVDVGQTIKRLPKPTRNQFNSFNKEYTTAVAGLRGISQNVGTVSDKIETSKFVSGLTKNKKEQYKKELSNIGNKVETKIKNIEKTTNKAKQLKMNIQKARGKVDNAVLNTKLQEISQKINQLQQLSTRLRLSKRQINLIRNSLVNTPVSPTPVTPKPRPTKTGKRIPTPGGLQTKKKKKKKETTNGFPEFQTEVRRKGKWKEVGEPGGLWEARKIGVQKTGKSLAQSFRLRKTGKKTKSEGDEFAEINRNYYKKQTKKGNVWIEKPKAKINTPQEKKKLKSARRRAKNAEDYWFGGLR